MWEEEGASSDGKSEFGKKEKSWKRKEKCDREESSEKGKDTEVMH